MGRTGCTTRVATQLESGPGDNKRSWHARDQSERLRSLKVSFVLDLKAFLVHSSSLHYYDYYIKKQITSLFLFFFWGGEGVRPAQ